MPENLTTIPETRPPSHDHHPAVATMKDRITIVTTYYMLPSAPRMTVLRKTIENLRKYLPIQDCRHLVYYHEPGDGSPRAAEHLENLKRLCEKYGLELYVRPDSGIKVNLIEALGAVTTPYMLFLEYDMAYKRKIDLARLLDVFDKYDFVNYVLFNVHMNDSLYHWGHLVHPEDRIPEVPLTRTSCWSNQAHVVRMSKWRDEWLGIIGTEKPPSPIHGLEDTMYWTYNREIFTRGFFEAQDRWGVYYYGAIDDGRTVHHTNGALNAGTVMEYVHKVKRRVATTLRQIRR